MLKRRVVEFRILGPLEVGGEPYRGGPKPRALLVSLLIARGSPVSTERLVDAVWGERPPASAAHGLQVYVSELRKAGLAIERHGDGYRLRPDWLDAAQFEGLLEAASSHRGSGRHEQALESIEEALALWRGPALVGLEDGVAVGAERERLEELRVAALEDRAESALALGGTPDLPELEQLAAEHPLRERLRRLLMLGLYRAGRQADALEVYAGIRHALDELGLEPAPELRALQGAILRQDAALDVEPEPVRQRRHLPAPATPFVGRRAEVDAIAALLRGDTRLVTLTGPGGAGKTRVALRAAHELADAFADGVWFVGLAPLVDPALVRPAIAQTLGLAEETLDEELRGLERLLLLDNFEQLLDAAPVVGELLQAAPRLRVLTTSRARLRLYGEHELEIPPLPAADAEELFVGRARATGRELPPGPLVTDICRRLDGLPLAIELVAARTAELTPAELMSSLDDRLELASKGARDLPERQRTLRAAIGWSHDLLDAPEQRLLAHLGAFAGGFTRDAVRAVCGEDAAEQLPGLVEASLVRRADDGRYRMLATIREYAVERLSERAEADDVRRRHADYFVELAEELVVALQGEGVDEAYATFEREHDNFRASLAFAGEAALAKLRYRLAAAVAHFWLVRGYLAEGRAWLEETLSLAPAQDVPLLLRAQVLRKLATLEWRQGEVDVAGTRAEDALPLLAGEVDEDERYRLLILLGCIEYSRRNREGSRDWWEQSAALARTLQNEAHLALALSNLGVVAAELRDYEGGVAIYEESVESARRAEHREYLAGALMGLGDMNLRLGRFESGRAQLTESMALYTRSGFRDRLASCCVWLAPAPEYYGDRALAVRLLGAAAGIRRQTGASLDWLEEEYLDELVARLRPALGDAAYDEAFAAGQSAPDAVVQEVLTSAAVVAAPVAGPSVDPGG
jgi:predicted ATPase/DNA-binding SARP family transcriptional activator